MDGSPLVGWLLVVVGAVTGASCLLRGRSGAGLGPAERRVARAEGVKGVGMALMAVPATVLDQRPWGEPLFVTVFGVMAAWSVWLTVRERRRGRGGHHPHLVVGAAAMVYMAVAMSGPAPDTMGGMGGMSGTGGHGSLGIPVLTGVLLVYFALYALWAGTRTLPSAGPAPAGPGLPGPTVLAAPELAAACRVSLGLGMFTMLLMM